MGNENNFIPDGLEWNEKEEGSFVEWLSYFVLSPEGTLHSRVPKEVQLFLLMFFCLGKRLFSIYPG